MFILHLTRSQVHERSCHILPNNGQYFWLFINFFKTKITWTTIIQQFLSIGLDIKINNYFKAFLLFCPILWISLTSPYERSWHVFKTLHNVNISCLEHGRWWNGSPDSLCHQVREKGLTHCTTTSFWNSQ